MCLVFPRGVLTPKEEEKFEALKLGHVVRDAKQRAYNFDVGRVAQLAEQATLNR